MDCQVCELRSSVGYCASCRKLLCEVCGVACSECGKLVCPDHVHESRSGKHYCPACQSGREAQRAAKKGSKHHSAVAAAAVAPGDLPESTSFSSLQKAPSASSEEELLEDESAVLTASAFKPKPPWQMSLYAACTGAVVILVILLIPGFRSLGQPWSSYLVLLVAGLGLFWALLGLTSPRHVDDRPLNLIGLGIAAVTALLVFWAIMKDPVREEEQMFRAAQEERMNMNLYQLEEWRIKRLQRFDY